MSHLASGDIDVQRGTLSEGVQGVDETVAMMVEMAQGEFGAKSAKIRALVINILNDANVGDKDYYGYAKAIHEWVRDNIRYIKDPIGQETLSQPEETAFNTKAEDCDGKTILEMAMLGSIGIRSYPVVVGVRPGSFSHVYLNIIIPEGGRPGRHAGEHIPADPIMREWPLGREAPAHKITQRKTYENLSGLGAMLDGYMTGPSYLDEQNLSSVRPAMHAPLVDTASRGEILNAPKVDEHNTTELDDMFAAAPVLAFTNAPPWELGPYGPITGAEAAGTYAKLPHRVYERAMPGPRSFTPTMKRIAQRLPGLAPDRVMVDHAKVNEETDDLSSLGVYIDSIMGEALSGNPGKVAATVKLVQAKLHNLRPVLSRGFLPGLGELTKAAHHVAAKARKLMHVSDIAAPQLARAGLAKLRQHNMQILAVARARAPITDKVRLIQGALYHGLPHVQNRVLRDEPKARNITPKLFTPLPTGSIIRDRRGNGSVVQQTDRTDDLADLGFSFSSVSHAISNAVHKVTKPITKVIPKKVLAAATALTPAGAASVMNILPSDVRKAAELAATAMTPAGALSLYRAVKPNKKAKKQKKPVSPAVPPVVPPAYPPVNPYAPNDPYANTAVQNYQQPYTDPYSSFYGQSAAGQGAPVDQFGPSSMSAPYEMDSATADSGGASMTDEVYAQGDQDPYGSDVSPGDDDAESVPGGDSGMQYDDTQALPTERPRKLRHRHARRVPEAAQYTDEDETEAPEYANDDDTEGAGYDDYDLDTGRVASQRDIEGLGFNVDQPWLDRPRISLVRPHGNMRPRRQLKWRRPYGAIAGDDAAVAGMSLTTLALLGLGAFLLFKKR